MARSNTKDRKRGKPSLKGEARRYSKLPREEIDKIDYKNIALLQRFITERGKIRSRRVTGLSRRDQSKMARAVKRARELGLLPYVDATRGPVERVGGGRGAAAASAISRGDSAPAPWALLGVGVVDLDRRGRSRSGPWSSSSKSRRRWWQSQSLDEARGRSAPGSRMATSQTWRSWTPTTSGSAASAEATSSGSIPRGAPSADRPESRRQSQPARVVSAATIRRPRPSASGAGQQDRRAGDGGATKAKRSQRMCWKDPRR